MQYPDRFWIYVAIAFASLLLLIIAVVALLSMMILTHKTEVLE